MRGRRVQLDFLTPLLAELESAGISPEQLYAATNLPATPPGASKAEIQELGELLLLQAAVEITGDAALPFRLGQQIDVTNSGIFGFALMSCPTLREALQLMLRYGKILGPAPTWDLLDQDGGLVLRMKMVQGSADQQLRTELVCSLICSTGTFLVNGPLEGTEIQLNYPEPSHSASYHGQGMVPVVFGTEHCQILLPERVLSKRVRTANPAGHVVFMQQCEEMLRGLNRVENTAAVVRRMLIQSAGAFPNISKVAEDLHISERTLRRRLKSDSTSFRIICDEIKNTLAREYLANTDLSLAEIAQLLDYTETVNFLRAFVRWNELTPSQYRRQ